jgi:large subunit ribosomal protein L22
MVADMIRGRSVDDAMSILRLQQRKAAKMLSKVLGSAIANATEKDFARLAKYRSAYALLKSLSDDAKSGN